MDDVSIQGLARKILDGSTQGPAIQFNGQWISWDSIRRSANDVSSAIATFAGDPSEPIGFIARNRPASVAALLALMAVGRTIRMIYAYQSAEMLVQDVTKLGLAAIVADEMDLVPKVRSAMRAAGTAAIGLGAEWTVETVAGDGQRTPAEAGPTPEFRLLTSGTTGAPKSFALPYATVARQMLGHSVLAASPDGKEPPPALVFFPLGNLSGLYSLLPSLLGGRPIVLLEKFDIAGWQAYVREHKPVRTTLPPAGVKMALDADIPAADLASLSYIGSGSAAVDPAVHRAFEERYGIPLLLSFGATEFCGPITAMTAELHTAWGKDKVGSVGRAWSGISLRVLDPETGDELPAGTDGILEVKSSQTGPDWVRTSDIVMVDADGFVFHRGRADGAILRGGFKVLPETVERALMLHASVSAAAVVGLADSRLGPSAGRAGGIKARLTGVGTGGA